MNRGGALFAIALTVLLIVTAGPANAQGEAAPSSGPPIRPTEITYTTPTNYDTFVQWWRDLEAQYPNYLHMWSPNQAYGLGQVPSSSAHPPYDLYMVRLTNESLGFAKPEVLFMGNPHGDERAGPIGAYWFVHWLLRHASSDQWNTPYDDWLRWLLDNREVYFLVSHNPDGFDRIRRCDATNIDLNREADHDGPEPAQSGCSRTPSQVFESVQGRTVARFTEEHQIRTGMDFHGGTRALLYPWGSTRSAVSAVSPVTGRTWNYAPPDFYYFDVFSHRMGDFMGDYDGAWSGNFDDRNVGTPPGIVGYVARGTYLSWAYGADTADNPVEAPYVDSGPYQGAGALWITPEISTIKNPAAAYYGGDDTLGFGIDVRRMILSMIDGAQPYVRWHPTGALDGLQVEQGSYFGLAWQVNGSLVVDATKVQWGTDPDPIGNPAYVTSDRTDFAGQFAGGTGWDGAADGGTNGFVWRETLRSPTALGTYYFVARAKVDQRYSQVLAPSTYGTDSYLRIVKERAAPGFAEDIAGADGLEHMEYREWWDSPVLRVEVVPDVTPPVVTLRAPPDGSVIRAGTPLDFDVFDGTLAFVTASVDGNPAAPLPFPWDLSTVGWADGTHTVRITAADQGGLVTTADHSFILDSTAPTIALISPAAGAVIRDGTILDLEIADLHLTTVTWTTGGPPTGLAAPYDVDTTGWAEGPVSVQVTAFDQAGNWRRDTFDFTIDSTAPVITLVSPANNSIFRAGTVLDFTVTDLTAIAASWSDGTGVRTLVVPYDVDTAGWADGPVAIEIAATDAVGLVTAASFTFEIDGTAPIVTFVSPGDGAVVRPGRIVDLSVVDDNLVGVEVDWGSGWITTPAPYDVDTTSWADGSYAIHVRAMDAAGNEVSVQYGLTIDGTPPSLARSDTGDFVPRGHLITFAIDDANLVAVAYDFGSGPSYFLPPYEFDTSGWPDGVYTIFLRAADSAGNEATLTTTLTVDGTPPSISAVSPAGDVLAQPGLVATFAVNDAHLDAVALVVDGTSSSFAAPYEVDTAGWPDGAHDVEVLATDLAGNAGSLSLTITIDGTPPVVDSPAASDRPVGSSIPVVVSSVTDAHGPASVTLHWRFADGGWQTVAMVEGAYGDYSAMIPAQSQPGAIELYVSAVDDAGNAAQTSPLTIHVTARPATQASGLPVWVLAVLIAAILAVIMIVLILRSRRSSPK